jgi:tetratricopeptide (TPR) repeat protein
MIQDMNSGQNRGQGSGTNRGQGSGVRGQKKRGIAFWLVGLSLIGALSCAFAWQWREKQADALLERAEGALARRDFKEARSDLLSYLSRRPKDGEAHWLLARTIRRSALYETPEPNWDGQVLHHLAESSRAKYDSEAIELESALLATARGDLFKYEAFLLGKIGQHDPDSAVILEALIPAYLSSRLLPQAMDQTTRLLAVDSENPQAWYWRGLIREQLFFSRLAREDFEKALTLKPDLEDARRRLARLQVLNKSFEEAAVNYESVLSLHSHDSEAILGMAQCCHGKGLEEEAQKWLDQLPQNVLQEGNALLLRGQLALQAGNYEEAERLLRQVIKLAPLEAQAYYSLARCLQQRGQLAESAALTAKFDRMTEDFHRYSALTDRMRSESRNPAVLCEAGMIQLRNGMTENGLGWLFSSLRMDPDFAPAHLALAKYYQENGDSNQAADHREHGLRGLVKGLGVWALGL